MNSNVKHTNGAIVPSMAVDRHADACGLPMFPARFRTDLINNDQADARAAIDNAMQSVGQVLEAALQAMTNLRAASAALEQSDHVPPASPNVGGTEKST
ncbi:hypothetical protein [Burkholderia ubonensis]|uniref:hypothetical protein n=1 Tax=Burkholderia ubonensis TaxID=101571 RepID=UPI000754DC11|nr:hypothetical protein [Burkholderia ubonensis]KVS41077.1 hypothetical protein WK37_20555 [Burkholderia ubonensis]KVS53237.1 hypothetical protein WK38_09470 [Burkholderia ubonensis]KVS71432.1 hypothetical protein WK42_24920 [Burkholderia ubonensis]KVS83505.1 hypothetical protein WK43_24915 [Burkholderia ubonensis]KVS88638.1 hypothetical protein WK45_27480 [Burkholderia ubonensis]